MVKKGNKQSEEHRKNNKLSHIGQKAWNKGLTKENNEGIKRISEKLKILKSLNHSGGVIKGNIPWNVGLTKENDERVKKNSENVSIALKGHKLLQETIDKQIKSRQEIAIIRGYYHSNKTRQNQRIAAIKYLKNNKNFTGPRIGKYEKQIIDAIEDRIGFNIKRGFYINGYYLDGYCQELNLAIEIDEKHHYKNDILRQRDIDKQNNIIKTLYCNFLRIKVEDIIKDNKVLLNEINL